jgi:type VI secretion system protein ImpA
VETLNSAIVQACNERTPEGMDIAFSDIYDQVHFAQQEDETQLTSGEWSKQAKKAQWKEVIELCANAIKTQSKDLQLLVWLVRAYTRHMGLHGCYIGLNTLLVWIEQWWFTGYPKFENSDYEERIAKLAWLDKHLSHALGLVTICEDDIGPLNWFSWEQSNKATNTVDIGHAASLKERWQRVIAKSHLTLAQQRDEISRCVHVLTRIHQALEQRVNYEAINLRSTEQTLNHMLRKFKDWTGQNLSDVSKPAAERTKHSFTTANDQSPDIEAMALVQTNSVAEYNAHTPHNRSHMLAELEKIARYFRTYEPFGPTAPMLERALAWANKPVDEWLSELVSDETTRQKIEDVLGAQLHR